MSYFFEIYLCLILIFLQFIGLTISVHIITCTHIILEHAVCLKSSLFWLNLRKFQHQLNQEFFFDTVYIKTLFALNEESCQQMHEVISEFKLILLSLNNYSIAVKWFLSNYYFYFLLLDERSYQPTPSRRTSKELPAAPQLQKYLRPSLSSTHTPPTRERMETACSSKFYT